MMAPHYGHPTGTPLQKILKVGCPAYILHYSILEWHPTFWGALVKIRSILDESISTLLWWLISTLLWWYHESMSTLLLIRLKNSKWRPKTWWQIFSRYVESISTLLCFDTLNQYPLCFDYQYPLCFDDITFCGTITAGIKNSKWW